MSAGAIVLGGHEVPAGSRRDLELPIARLPHGAQAALPVVVVHGRQPGPGLWLTAALHGDELTGVEVIRRVLARVTPDKLVGSLVAVPMVNVFGVTEGSRYLPDRRDLNRSFPGSRNGSLASRLAHLLMTEVVTKGSVGIDLHSGSDHRGNLPQVRAALDDPRTRELALTFGAPVLIDAKQRSGSLRGEAGKRGATVLLYEGGGAHAYDEGAVGAGVEGVRRVMAALGMTPTATVESAPPSAVSTLTRWSRARRGGLFRAEVALGARVKQGQRVGTVADAVGRTVARITARTEGLVIGLRTNPVVFQGDALVHVAAVEPGQDASA